MRTSRDCVCVPQPINRKPVPLAETTKINKRLGCRNEASVRSGALYCKAALPDVLLQLCHILELIDVFFGQPHRLISVECHTKTLSKPDEYIDENH